MSDLPKCKPPCPGPHAHTTRHGTRSCNAHVRQENRRGLHCLNPPSPGATVCPMHGGRSGHVRRKAAERVAKVEAEREVARLGARRDIHPAEALLDLVHWTAGEVDYWRHRVTQLDDDDLTWGVTRIKEGGDDRGTTSEAKPHIAYAMLERASDRLASYAAAALKAGVDERRIRLAESQGQLVAQAVRTILDQLRLTPAQLELVPTIVPAALRAIADQETQPA